MELFCGEELQQPGVFLVMMNGRILGVHRQPRHFTKAFRHLRRYGMVVHLLMVDGVVEMPPVCGST